MVLEQHLAPVENEAEQIKSLGVPYGRNSSTCGYCSPPGERTQDRTNHHLSGLDTSRLTCQVFISFLLGLGKFEPPGRVA